MNLWIKERARRTNSLSTKPPKVLAGIKPLTLTRKWSARKEWSEAVPKAVKVEASKTSGALSTKRLQLKKKSCINQKLKRTRTRRLGLEAQE